MRLNIEFLISRVLARLGETPSSSSAFAGEEEGLRLRELVRQLAPECAAKVIMEAPLASLDGFSRFGQSVGWLTGGAGYVMLPDDFLRLVSFRMSDWDYAVSAPLERDTMAWRFQSLPCPAFRGQADRPVCRIVERGVGRALEFYSCRTEEATVSEGLYVARPYIDTENYLHLPWGCVADTVVATAGEVAKIF